jgi:hypothetical protein
MILEHESIKPRLRNPYPSIDFEKAYEYLNELIRKFPNKSVFDRQELLEEGLGFAEKNSAGHNVVGSLIHYGLIERSRSNRIGQKGSSDYIVTQPAYELLASEQDIEKWQRLASNHICMPELFGYINLKYPNTLPPRDVFSFLNRKFNSVDPKKLRAAIERYNRNFNFIKNPRITTSGNEPMMEQKAIQKPNYALSGDVDIDLGSGISVRIPQLLLAKIVKDHLSQL